MKNQIIAPKGALIVFEGIDGSGKSTQIKKMKKYLKNDLNRKVKVIRWKSSHLVGDYLNKLSDLDEQPSALALSIIIAADLSENIAKKVLPALARGYVVLCDRYSFTGIVRDSVVNNFDVAWLNDLYSFVPKPDKVFYFRVNTATSIDRVDYRLKKGMSKLVEKMHKKYGNVSHKKVQSLLNELKGTTTDGSMAGSMEDTLRSLKKGERIFQVNGDPLTEEVAKQQREDLITKLLQTYDRMSKDLKFTVVDAMQSVKNVSAELEDALSQFLAK